MAGFSGNIPELQAQATAREITTASAIATAIAHVQPAGITIWKRTGSIYA